MRGSCRALLISACAIAALFAARAQNAEIPKFTEDFEGLKYCDTSTTTAWWDYSLGILRLYNFMPTIVDTLETPGWAMDIEVSGDRLYVADGGLGGLRIYDISDPENIIQAGWYDTPGTAYGVALSGNHAFVADGSAGLTVIDITDTSNPVFTGGVDTPDNALGIAVEGNLVFIADEDAGLVIIEITDPSAPVVLDTCDTPGDANDVDVSGDYAYVADFAVGGLQVIDISNPSSAVIVDSYNTPGTAYGVTVEGDYAYVADWGSGLTIVDISDPTDLSLAGSVDPGYVHDVEITGDYLYAGGFTGGLHVIDIRNPASPSLIVSCDTYNAFAAAVDGQYAYVADYTSGIKSVRICQYAGLNPAGELMLDAHDDIVIEGSLAFIGEEDLLIIDISDPESPVLMTQYNVPGEARSVDVSGDHAFVGTNENGMIVADISDPEAPSIAGSYYFTSSVGDIKVSGDNAYLALYQEGLLVLDISDPANPSYAGAYNTLGYTTELLIYGDYLLSAEQDYCVYALDISDPEAPSFVDSWSCLNMVFAFAHAGECMFAVDQDLGSSIIRSIDISDPSSMSSIGGISYSDANNYFFEGLLVSGNLLMSTNQYYGLMAFDSRNPVSMDVVDQTPLYFDPEMGGETGDLALYGDYVVWGSDERLGLVKVYDRIYQQGMAQSTVFSHLQDPAVCARVSSSQSDSIMWEVSADSCSNWTEIPEGSGWIVLDNPGKEMFWRCYLFPVSRDSGPSCDLLEVEWLYEMASIDSIVDVPGDQGGWVRVFFSRSGYDVAGNSGSPISSYYLYRRIDDMLLSGRIVDFGKETGDGSLVYDDRIFRVIQTSAADFPPGLWEVVGESPALDRDQYIILAPTTADSSAVLNETVFCVIAVASPSEWYVSYPDSGWSVDNIAPGVPSGMEVAYNTGSGNTLDWNDSPEEDFQYYRVYRGDSEDFVPGQENLVHETAVSAWCDPEYDGWNVYYKVTALDHAGNESDPAEAGSVTGDDFPAVPASFALHQNVPNPFNPMTEIRFDLPRAVDVKLCVFNVKGELVNTLIDQYMVEGRKEIVWTATDSEGRRLSSGIYFYRLVTEGFVQTRKMVLIR